MQDWKAVLDRAMSEAIAEEKALAEQDGDYYEVTGTGGGARTKNVPFISVSIDGGWCRRSYGHSYQSKSGVVSFKSFSLSCRVTGRERGGGGWPLDGRRMARYLFRSHTHFHYRPAS